MAVRGNRRVVKRASLTGTSSKKYGENLIKLLQLGSED